MTAWLWCSGLAGCPCERCVPEEESAEEKVVGLMDALESALAEAKRQRRDL